MKAKDSGFNKLQQELSRIATLADRDVALVHDLETGECRLVMGESYDSAFEIDGYCEWPSAVGVIAKSNGWVITNARRNVTQEGVQ